MSKWGRHRARKNGIKGPVFGSFFNQETPKPHKQYLAHSKMRAALRNLRHICGPIFKLKDEASIAAIARCKRDVAGEPEPLYAQLHLMRAALEAAQSTGVTWAESMNYLLDKFDQERNMTGSIQAMPNDPSFQGENDGKQSGDNARDGSHEDEQDQLGANHGQEGVLGGASA